MAADVGLSPDTTSPAAASVPAASPIARFLAGPIAPAQIFLTRLMGSERRWPSAGMSRQRLTNTRFRPETGAGTDIPVPRRMSGRMRDAAGPDAAAGADDAAGRDDAAGADQRRAAA
ncbi:MAG: hypothetical protein NVS9B8_10790 [Candidatus Limnocylindrales bacterium]